MKNLRTKRGRIYTPTGAIVLILLTYKSVSVQSLVQKVASALFAAMVALWTTELVRVLFVGSLLVMDFAYGIRANRARRVAQPIRTQLRDTWKLLVEFAGVLFVFVGWSNLWVGFAWVQLAAYAYVGYRLTTSFLSKLDQASAAFEIGHWLTGQIRRQVTDSMAPDLPIRPADLPPETPPETPDAP